MLVRRAIPSHDEATAPELAHYLCYGPADTPLPELARIAGTRWAVEECFQSAKNEVGLDQYQVRRYDAWHRHITLAMLAHAYLGHHRRPRPKSTGLAVSLPPRPAVSWHT